MYVQLWIVCIKCILCGTFWLNMSMHSIWWYLMHRTGTACRKCRLRTKSWLAMGAHQVIWRTPNDADADVVTIWWQWSWIWWPNKVDWLKSILTEATNCVNSAVGVVLAIQFLDFASVFTNLVFLVFLVTPGAAPASSLDSQPVMRRLLCSPSCCFCKECQMWFIQIWPLLKMGFWNPRILDDIRSHIADHCNALLNAQQDGH